MLKKTFKNKIVWLSLFVLSFLLSINSSQAASSLASRLQGYILLQVESLGEAWYVIPKEQQRVYMKDGAVAYQIMREVSLGITNANLAKIPVGIEARFNDVDTDGDGLSDNLEKGLDTDPNKADTDNDGFSDGEEIKNNYSPLGPSKLVYDNNLVNRLKGYILLQVEKQGQAWYVNPKDGKRYYMQDGPAAYNIMRYLSLGITNKNLDLVPKSSRVFKVDTAGNSSNQGNQNNQGNQGNNNNSTSTPPGNSGNQGGNSGGGGGGGGGNNNPPSADNQAPSAPTNLAATAAGTQISLAWTASTDNVGVVGYQILRSTTNGSGYTQIATTNSTSYTNTSLTIGTTYYYVVKAYDAAGNVSTNSSQAQATTTDTQSPTAPSNLVASASGTQISLSWSASADNVGVAQYIIERSNSAIVGFSQVATSTTSVYTNTRLSTNTTYYYRVRAQDTAGNYSEYSAVVSATTNNDLVVVDTQKPSTPTNLLATASGLQISLSWSASTDNVGVVGYQVLRSTTNGSGYEQIATSNTNSYTNNNLNIGTTYYYIVRAYDAAGNVSLDSAQAQATIPVPADIQAPTAPSALTAIAASREVALSWSASTDNTAVTGYQILRSTTNGSAYVQQTTVNTTVYVDTGLTNGTTYYYVVKAYDAAGNISQNSNQAQAIPVDTVAPSAPSSLVATASGTQVSLTWSASTDNMAVSQYLIERSTSASSGFTQIATSNTTSYTNSGLPNNAIYYYRVRAQDSSNNYSNYSNTVSATVGTVVTTGPSISSVSGNISNGQTITISGSNFGSKTQASPLIWDNFEDGINNVTIRNTNPVIGPAWSVWTNGTDPVYTNTSNRANSTRNALFDFSGGTGYTKFLQYSNANVDSTYFTFWWRYDKTSTQWSANIKPWDEFGTHSGGICPSIYSGFGSPTAGDGYLRASVTDCSLTTGEGHQLNSNMYSWLGYSSPIDEIQGQWVRMEIYVKQSSAPGVADGVYKMWVHKPDGEGITLDISADNIVTRDTTNEWYQWWLLGAYHTMDDRSPNATGQVRGDDVYFDTSQARIELGNASTWLANTHREIQVPGTWSSGSLSFTVNSGAFTSGQTAYLYVVDGNGNVNSNGYPVTISGTSVADTTAPSTPSNLSASASGTNISLTWSASTDNVGVARYLVERSTSASSGFTQIATPTTSSYTDSGLANSTTYYYRVRAQDTSGNNSSYSSNASATTGAPASDTTIPSTPSNLSALASGTNISLTWSASTDNVGVARYLVERSTSASSGFTQIATPTTSSYTDSGLANSTTYYYRVRAQDNANNTSSYSSTANATTAAASVSTTNLIQNSWDFSSAAWDGDALGANPWSPKSNFTFTSGQADPLGTSKAFRIALSTSNRPYQQRDSTPNLTLNYDTVTASLYVKYGNSANIIFGLNDATTNTEYEQTFNFNSGVPVYSSGTNDGTTITNIGNGWYRLSMRLNLLSRGISGHSFKGRVTPAGSASASGTYSYVAGFQLESGTQATTYVETPSGTSDTTIPSTPSNLSALASGTNISLTWSASTDNVGVARYLVERSTSASSGFTQIATPTTSSYTDSGLANSTTYYYRVRAQDSANNTSSYSSTANATTGSSTPPPSGSVSITGVSGTLSQGQTVTISGSGFGTKSTVSPLVYDTMESGSFSSAWQSYNQLTIGSDAANRRNANSTYYGTNNFQNNLFKGAGFFTGSNSQLRDTWYARYWFKLDNNWDWGTTGYPDLTDASLANVKFFRLWNPGDTNEDYVMATQGFSGGGLIAEASNIPGTVSYFGSQSDWTKGTWHVLDFAFKENSSLGAADGVIKMWSDGKKILDKSNLVTRGTFSGLKRPLILGFYNSWWDSAANSDRDDFYIDDAYLDGSWSRVMLCNQSTWNDSVSRNCEIQAPQSTWTNNSLQISFNAGSFTSGQTAYLYVVDSNGNVNSSGYPVTISGVLGANVSSCNTPDQDTINWTSISNNTLVRGCGSAIYVIQNNKRVYINSLEVLRNQYPGQRIYNINNDLLLSYPLAT